MATLGDCTCPICLCILIEPVTMPCKHSICLPCYKQTVEKANLCCPLCRLRISVWARKSVKAGTLIDSAKWDAIKKEFPAQVQKQMEGKDVLDDDDDDDSERYETRLRQLMALSKPGEIREEYEAELQKLQRRWQEEAKLEEEASAALIRSLQLEEEKEKGALERIKEEQDRLDREIAEKLHETFVSEDDEIKQEESEAETTSSIIFDSGNKSLNKKAVSKLNKGKCKQLKSAAGNNLTMAIFFSPVPREKGLTSPVRRDLAPRKLHMGSSDAADLTSHTFLYDGKQETLSHYDLKQETLSHISSFETEGFVSSNVHFLGNQHPSVNKFGKASAGDALEDHTVDNGVVCETNLNFKALNRFVAGPSGLGRCGAVRSATFQDLRTHFPANTAQENPESKHAHTKSQRPPIEICNMVLYKQRSSDPSGSSLAARDEAAGMTTAHNCLASSTATSSLRISHAALDSLVPQIQTHPAQNPDAGETFSIRQKESVLSHRNIFENFGDGVELSLSSENAESESQEALLADPENVDCNCNDHTQTTSDNVKLTVDSSSKSSLFNKPDDQLTESGDGTIQNCKDAVNDSAHTDGRDVCVRSGYSHTTKSESGDCGSASHGYNDTTKRDRGDSVAASFNDTTKSDCCTGFFEDLCPSRQESVHKALWENQSKTCNMKSKCNSEKENRFEADCKQFKDVKINSKIEDHHQMLNPIVKVFRVKTHSVKKPKKSILSVAGTKTESEVSIMRWCVPNCCQGELQTKNIIVDKPEPGHKNSQSVLSYFGKRKNSVSGDGEEEKNVFDDGKQINDIHGANRKEAADASDAFCRKKKRLKWDSVADSPASVEEETSAADVLDLDDVDASGMSQEELDHLMAVRLQEMYSRLDQKDIRVDRFKGSKGHYLLRKKSARK